MPLRRAFSEWKHSFFELSEGDFMELRKMEKEKEAKLERRMEREIGVFERIKR